MLRGRSCTRSVNWRPTWTPRIAPLAGKTCSLITHCHHIAVMARVHFFWVAAMKMP